MLCCVSSSSTVDDEISATSEERRQRIVPGFTRPESELDWEEITVFQWPNDGGSEGYQKPASVIGSTVADDIAKRHQEKVEAANRARLANKNFVPVQPVPIPKKRQGLFTKNDKNGRLSAGGPERLPGDLNRPPPAPPLPPGRDDLPHLTARRLKPDEENGNNPPKGQLNGSAHRKAVPLHGNIQLNFSVSADPVADKPTQPIVIAAATKQENNNSKKETKPSETKRSRLSIFKRPTFLSDSAFGTKKKKKSSKSYRAPEPPGPSTDDRPNESHPVPGSESRLPADSENHPPPSSKSHPPPSSIDTGITEGRLPMADKMPYGNRMGTIKEPPHWEQTQEAIIEEEESDRDRSPSERLVGKYDPNNYISKVPLQDASGNELPQWKRLLIAKQFAEKELNDDEERARREEEEKRFKDMPGWKRAILEKKEAENKAKREREEQDIAAIEWAKRNPSHTIALDEDGLPMTPWQAEMRERKDSKSSYSDRSSRATSSHLD